MTFVVTENCIKCKHTDCVEVCPVDCFYEGPNFLVIHPDECIDCALCEPECPVEAIFAEEDLPEADAVFLAFPFGQEFDGLGGVVVGEVEVVRRDGVGRDVRAVPGPAHLEPVPVDDERVDGGAHVGL